MGQLLEDTLKTIDKTQEKIDLVLAEINNYNEIYNSDYVLKELRDADYLKERMIEKVELGVKSYDNQ